MARWHGMAAGMVLFSFWSITSWRTWCELTSLRQQVQLRTFEGGGAILSGQVQFLTSEERGVILSGRRLADLGFVDYASSGPTSGCVRVDTSDAAVRLNLRARSCGGTGTSRSRCPPCFGLNATPGGVAIHPLVLINCSSMYLSATMRLGDNPYQDALQPISFVNLSPDTVAAVSDGINHFEIPAGAREVGYCLAGDDNTLRMRESYRKYMRAGASWTQLESQAAWSAREMHRMVVRKDGVLVLAGGSDSGGNLLNDVWASGDGGSSWALLGLASWAARNNHGMVVRLDGALVIAGGLTGGGTLVNDVWASSDGGTSWQRLTADAAWSARENFALVMRHDGALVLASGNADGWSLQNDVWESTDGGSQWVRLTDQAGWSTRTGLTMALRLDGALVIAGGFSGTAQMNDVWESSNGGQSWSQLTSSANFSGRSTFAMVVRHDGALIVTGGLGCPDATVSYTCRDVWASKDGGSSWFELVDPAAFSARYIYAMAVRQDGALVIAGGKTEGSYNDVWASFS